MTSSFSEHSIQFRPYERTDLTACLALFDANCPQYFAPNERTDYAEFLQVRTEHYIVCLIERCVVGAFGIYPIDQRNAALHWILLSPSTQGRGLGTAIMNRVIAQMRRNGHSSLNISASHRSAPFFARFGAQEISTVPHGWGPDMHRVEMLLEI